MFRIGRMFEINLKMLKEWEKEVMRDLSERCVSNIISIYDVTQGTNEKQEKLFRVLQKLRDAKNSNKELKERICKFEGMITEMNSVIMDIHCAKNELNQHNIEIAKESSTTVEEREDKGKKTNAYAQLMNSQKKSVAIDHFDGCMQWDMIEFVSEAIKEKKYVIQKMISPNAKKNPCTQGLGGNC